MKMASKIMIGSGMPNNHNNAPFPKPMAILHRFFEQRIRGGKNSSSGSGGSGAYLFRLIFKLIAT
jgi:hypothetical protein